MFAKRKVKFSISFLKVDHQNYPKKKEKMKKFINHLILA